MAGRTLVATFTGNTAQLEAATSKANKALGTVGKQSEKQSSKMKTAFAGIAGAFAGAAIGKVIKDSISAASDLNETTSKVQQVFGDASNAVIKFSDTTAKSMGLSKQSALDAAATFGVFGKSAGLQGKGLSDFTTKFTGLAADLASFNNTTPEQAIEALGAAFRGEAEPMRQYGVLLDDASLRQEALRQGLIKTTKDALTPQQKVLAAQGLILKQTSLAQGDFARTSDGLANQQRILTAQFDDAQAKLGQALLPILVKVFGFLNNTAVPALQSMADFISRNQKVITLLAVALAGFATAVFLVNKTMALWESTTKALSTVMGIFTTKTQAATVATEEQGAAAATSGKKMAGMGKAMGIAGVAFAGLVVGAEAIKAIQRATDDAVPGLEGVKKGLIDVGKSGDVSKLGKDFNDLGSNLDRIFNKSRGQSITDTLQTPFVGIFGKSGSLRQAEEDLKALDAGLAGLVSSGNAQQAADAFTQIAEKAKAQGVSVDQLKKMFPGYEDALAGVKNESSLAATGQDTFTGSTKAATDAAADQKKGLDDLKNSFDDIIKANFGVSDATDAYAQDIADLKGKITDARKAGDAHAVSLRGQSQAARDNRAAVEGLVADSAGLIKAWIDAGVHGAALNKKIDAQRTALYNTLIQMGFNKEEARRYAATLGTIKTSVKTNVALTISDAQAKIAAFQRYVNSRQFKIAIQAEINVTTVKRPGPQVAGGGAIRGPGGPRSDVIPAWLSNGEYVINAASARRIGIPALNRLNRMASGGTVPRLAAGGGVTGGRARGSDGATVNVNALLANPAETGRAVVDALRAYERAAGHGWRLGNDLGAA